jgi:hypothetical protein
VPPTLSAMCVALIASELGHRRRVERLARENGVRPALDKASSPTHSRRPVGTPSYKRLKLAQLPGQLGTFLTLRRRRISGGLRPRPASSASAASASSATSTCTRDPPSPRKPSLLPYFGPRTIYHRDLQQQTNISWAQRTVFCWGPDR